MFSSLIRFSSSPLLFLYNLCNLVKLQPLLLLIFILYTLWYNSIFTYFLTSSFSLSPFISFFQLLHPAPINFFRPRFVLEHRVSNCPPLLPPLSPPISLFILCLTLSLSLFLSARIYVLMCIAHVPSYVADMSGLCAGAGGGGLLQLNKLSPLNPLVSQQCLQGVSRTHEMHPFTGRALSSFQG